MSVSDFLNAAICDKISIVNNGNLVYIDRNDAMDRAAWGDFLIDKLTFTAVAEIVFCEITLKTTFLKKGA